MSHSQKSTNNSERGGSRSGAEQLNEAPDQLPAFQSFPAARKAQPGSTSGYQAASAPAVDDADVRGSRHETAAQELLVLQCQLTVNLPAFTPFPDAAPSSRYAPPEGVRAAPPRPVPTPLLSAERPEYPGGSIRYPSTLIPLTARPQVCEHCEAGFARAHDPRWHMDTHEGERPHKCPICQQSFSRRDAVQRHLMLANCGSSPSGSGSSKYHRTP
ncbi:hypothetical protein BDV93DRAFT_522585 [Ceratobasidium sp. AG-I]|nr:hypothetical protein BDV93DRAFT_522585 [Ceratobasidium sp. AG-I]